MTESLPFVGSAKPGYTTNMVGWCLHLLGQLHETIEELEAADELNGWFDRIQEHERSCPLA